MVILFLFLIIKHQRIIILNNQSALPTSRRKDDHLNFAYLSVVERKLLQITWPIRIKSGVEASNYCGGRLDCSSCVCTSELHRVILQEVTGAIFLNLVRNAR